MMMQIILFYFLFSSESFRYNMYVELNIEIPFLFTTGFFLCYNIKSCVFASLSFLP